ncbi:transporter [Flavilitoribacter nigricans DSM 23189 = NBRC 102662]|uniref:Transporter n=2 Tax=Flavilitoribacter TaxID=2762562 RepID=A0A2D0MWV6_FLAN2|nr:transporter [Flavilitoribacter nigricans DSM 23189 = NBRC 102662]
MITHFGRAQSTTLSLQDALQYALQHSLDLRSAALDVANGEYQIAETRSRALPQVSATGNLTDQYKKQRFILDGALAGQPGETVAIESGTTWSANAGINVSQTIFDQSVFTALKASRAAQDFYRLSYDLAEEQIIEIVANSYYQVLVQRQKLGVIDSNLVNTQKTYNIINNLLENGLARKIDLDRTAVGMSNLKTQRQQLLNGIEQLENQLKFYMGMPLDTEIELPSAEFDELAGRAEVVDISTGANFTNRLSYQVLEQQANLLKYQKEAYKAEYYPSLSFTGNYSIMGVSDQFVLFRGENRGANWFGFGSIGLNLRVPIYNGRATRARLDQAEVSIQKNALDLRRTTQQLELADANARTQIYNTQLTLENQQENVELAQQVYENTENNYHNGLATLTDLLDAQNTLTQAQNNYATTLLDYRLAEIQLIKSQGNLKSLLN